MKTSLRFLLSFTMIVVGLTLAAPAAAQTSSQSSSSAKGADDWKITIYPILGWAPIFGADVNLPSLPDNGGGEGGSGSTEGIIDSRLNGALMFGASVERGPWRTDVDGMWAALTGDRPVNPKLDVKLDFVYGHASGGRKVFRDLYATVGVRRLALKYDIQLGDLPEFTRKPGLWDPLIGIGWHREGKKVEWHAILEGNVFNTGADEDVVASGMVDWKPTSHVGLAFGYGGIDLKITDTVAGQTFTASQTLHGPIVGLGLYF